MLLDNPRKENIKPFLPLQSKFSKTKGATYLYNEIRRVVSEFSRCKSQASDSGACCPWFESPQVKQSNEKKSE